MKSIVSIKYLKQQLQEAAATKIAKAFRKLILKIKFLLFCEYRRQLSREQHNDSESQSSSASYNSSGSCQVCHDKGPKGLYCYSCEDSGSIYC